MLGGAAFEIISDADIEHGTRFVARHINPVIVLRRAGRQEVCRMPNLAELGRKSLRNRDLRIRPREGERVWRKNESAGGLARVCGVFFIRLAGAVQMACGVRADEPELGSCKAGWVCSRTLGL